MLPHNKRAGIAVIGLSCRYPQASSLQEFWELISNGRSVFQNLPISRQANHPSGILEKEFGGFLEQPYHFDPTVFNIPEEEALMMDPQQRIILELAVEAIEDAGYGDFKNQLAGVFMGANQRAYLETVSSQWYRQRTVEYIRNSKALNAVPDIHRRGLNELLKALESSEALHPNILVGNLSNMISSRVSHELNLKGPSLSVDTACSSSLMAVHLACESLYNEECEIALAGGVNLNLSPAVFQYMRAAGVISPTNKCIPFSKSSNGILLGEGAGVVVLKRLKDAMHANDPIWAVIRGSGVNNDGRSMGIMAPSWKGQLELLKKTYSRYGYTPANITAIESHGTSTRIGDGVELSVIERFFPCSPEKPISVGSVKSNLGHTLGAAGIAGLTKIILALHHRQLPPSLHEAIDPEKRLAEKGIAIQSKLADWVHDAPLAAGLS